MLTKKDKLLLRELQDNFPLVERPFAKTAARFGLREDEVIGKLRNWKKRKVIRYFGAIFDTGKLGICSTLVAMKVAGRDVKRVSRIVNAFPEVSHNYLRRGEYSMWFTLSAHSRKELRQLFLEIKKRTGVREALDLAAIRVFKIDARFGIG
ncbi:MAG: Lrp/AsnC family transcriptional regulator [Candidatus Omnitrophica bacterium]|nr:Lrp/AsnC family transcriptional regulator [Candidatus Omnitrophota bacterium]